MLLSNKTWHFCQVCDISAKFCASFVKLPTRTSWQKIANLIRGFCTEWLRVGKKLSTQMAIFNVEESATNVAERYLEEFIPNLANTPQTLQKKPRTWQKKTGTWQSFRPHHHHPHVTKNKHQHQVSEHHDVATITHI